MSTLNFDTDTWYQINVTRQTGQSFMSSYLYDNNGTTGSVFFQITNTSHAGQSWQIWPYNSSVYLLRTRDGGPDGYLASSYDSALTEVTGNTAPYLVRYNISDDSMFWRIEPWGDGTYYFFNLANGSDWRLWTRPNSLMAMTSNITAPQVGEQYTFRSIGTINDSRFSTYNLYPTSGTTPAPASSTASTQTSPKTETSISSSSSSSSSSSYSYSSSSSLSAPSSSSSSSSGLSTGAAAGIGIAAALGLIIIFSVAAWWFMRRRKSRLMQPNQYSQGQVTIPDDHKQDLLKAYGGSVYGGSAYDGSTYASSNISAAAEIPTHFPLSELPSNNARAHMNSDSQQHAPVELAVYHAR